ncbi:MAG: hypothetical protein LHW64_02215 [Candidatus Cloacimonetes bacterium]|jgi:hypothetical protein|nr:hypothetical protein [Candidatus Cloacimonadota bacterium]MCB5286603.1 hypothetical protein [Candidatus Cloacimonadota bacterium]MCK9184347.1 hypothetical protein [Candidatus Cloacimonadota bacterium]MCK9583544.1 hypothetical protein [Candidatus Cloacimonadota bacterium]MDY0228924.1 hypothetical protein [Candidatus Cloacimonadaceae bacterium]
MAVAKSRLSKLRLWADALSKRGLCLLLLCATFSWLMGYQLLHESPYHELYGEKSATAADLDLSRALSQKIADLQITLSIYPKARVKIYIVHGEQEYHKLSLGKAEIVEFSDAFYSGADRAIYIRSQDQILENYLKILVHEYIHWYLEELFISAPLWFHEGMATYFSGQMGYERYLMYLRESLINPKSDLFRIGYFYPENKADWPRFYLGSAMAVRYMQDKHQEQWGRFWNIVAAYHHQEQKVRFSEAFANAYHTSLWDFHQDFERYSKRQGYLYLIVAINSLIFAFLAILMPFAARKRRRRMRNMPDLPDLPDISTLSNIPEFTNASATQEPDSEDEKPTDTL